MFGGASQTPFGSPSGGFGQSPAAPAFGSPAPAPFGQQAPATGGFGGGSTFGAPPPAAPGGFSGFGQPAQPSTGFGGAAQSTGFGAAPAQPTGFGQSTSTGFGGQTATGSPFGGQPATAGGLFGGAPAPALFGAPSAPPQGGGAFGTPASTGFGASSPNTGFGSAPTSTFGATSTQTTAFGAPSPGLFGSAPAPATGGLFGSAPAPSGGAFGSTTGGFGATAPTSAFGASTPAPSGGMFGSSAQTTTHAFGSPAAGTGGGGTRIAPFQPQSRQDGSNNILLHSITAMPPYENKSFDELRLEDYRQGNKGSATAAPTSAFGSQPAAPGGGLFGAPAPAPVGGGLFGATPNTGAFGAPAPVPTTGGLFGSAPVPAPAAFGAAPASTGLFGQQAQTGGFGAAPAPATGGLFGSTPAPSTGGFGASPTPAIGGMFGAAPAPSTGGLFGAAPAAPAPFGSPSPATGGLFGSTAPTPAASGGLFGAPAPPSAFGAPTGGGLFGAPAPVGGLFGSPAPAPFGASTPAAPNLFGSTPTSAGGGLFGAPTAAPGVASQPQAYGAMISAPPLGSVIAPTIDEILTSRLAALEAKRKELEEKDNFRNQPSQSSAITAISQRENMSILPVSTPRISSYRVSPSSHVKIRPRGFASPPSDKKLNNMPQSLSKLGRGGKPMAAPDVVAAASKTNLIIKNGQTQKPKLKLALRGSEKLNMNDTSSSSAPIEINRVNNNGAKSKSGLGSVQKAVTNIPVTTPHNAAMNGLSSGSPRTKIYDADEEYYRKVIGSQSNSTVDENASGEVSENSNGVPTLSKEGYSCNPSIAELQRMGAADLAAVTNFSITREGVGKVEWIGAVDVRGADLDSIVVIEEKAVSVYTEEEHRGLKPENGTKLNRRAKLTLENVFPKKNESAAFFKRKVSQATAKMGAEIIKIDLERGQWVFIVQHFSRYALDDDDSVDDNMEVYDELNRQRNVDFESPEALSNNNSSAKILRESTPFKALNFVLSDNDDDDVIMTETIIMEKAEMTFNQMQATVEKEKEVVALKERNQKQTAVFPEEGASVLNDKIETTENFKYIPSASDFRLAASMSSFSSTLLSSNRSNITSSNTDFGLRMGKSFRVGWFPGGSFLSMGKNGVILRRKPKFEDNISINREESLLRTHHTKTNKTSNLDNCPIFAFPSNESNTGKTLHAYLEAVENTEGSLTHISKSAFSLLQVLQTTQHNNANNQQTSFAIEGKPVPDYVTNNQCMVCIKNWLIDSCSSDVEEEIRQARDSYEALFIAVSGGVLSKAAKIAEDANLTALAIILASGPDARDDIFNEIIAWRKNHNSRNQPEFLLRTYRLLAGDFGMEENIYKQEMTFDWKRRMIMKLMYSKSSESLPDVVSHYESDVSKGIAPFPGRKCDSTVDILFRLMKLLPSSSTTELSLSNIVDPVGFTRDTKNFSLSFHLTSCITAMYRSPVLSQLEEHTILDGYAFLLQSIGLWEWGVYVFLCVLSAPAGELSWRVQRAKSLVLQNFNSGKESLEKGKFLKEHLDLPISWFEEALCYRSLNSGEVLEYISNKFKLDQKEGLKVVERTMCPNILFTKRESQEKLLELFDELLLVEEDSNTLVWAVSTFFEIYDEIQQLEISRENNEKEIPALLLEDLEKMEKVFISYKERENKMFQNTLDIIPASYCVSMAAFLSEALHQTSVFKLQIFALKEGMTITSTASQKMKFMRSKGNNSQIRWLM